MEQFDQSLPQDALPVFGIASTGAPPLPAEAYWHYLDGMDLTDAEKTGILETLWTIMAQFVDLGFGIDPVQQVLPSLLQRAFDAGDDTGGEEPARASFQSAAGDTEEGETAHDNTNI